MSPRSTLKLPVPPVVIWLPALSFDELFLPFLPSFIDFAMIFFGFTSWIYIHFDQYEGELLTLSDTGLLTQISILHTLPAFIDLSSFRIKYLKTIALLETDTPNHFITRLHSPCTIMPGFGPRLPGPRFHCPKLREETWCIQLCCSSMISSTYRQINDVQSINESYALITGKTRSALKFGQTKIRHRFWYEACCLQQAWYRGMSLHLLSRHKF